MENSAYYAKCYRTLKKLGAPTSRWWCELVIDYGSEAFTCELCGCKKVRYVHVMEHADYPDKLRVGCICAGVMEGNILNAQKRDHEARLRSQRKSNYLKKQWAAISEDCWQLRYKHRHMSIERDVFYGREFFKLTIDGEQFQWKDNQRMTSFLTAQHLAFGLMEENYA